MFNDAPDVLVRGRYYFSPTATPFVDGPTLLGSRNWDGNGTINGTEPVGLFPVVLGETRGNRQRWDSGALPVALPEAITLGSLACLLDGDAVAHGIGPIDRTGGFPTKCFIPQHVPNNDYEFGFSVWSCPTQLFWADTLTLLGGGHYADVQAKLLPRFVGSTVIVVAKSNLYPMFAVVVHPAYCCVVSAGTDNLAQVLIQALQLVAGPQDYGTFSTGGLWYDYAEYLLLILSSLGVMDSRPILLAGHSYGGCSAIILAARIRAAQPIREIRYITYGSPKPGDVRLSSYVRDEFDGVSLCNDGDFITALPPDGSVIAAMQAYLPISLFAPWILWTYPPESALLYKNEVLKNTYQRFDSQSLAAYILNVIVTGKIATVTAHAIQEYGKRIRLRCSAFLPTDIGEVLACTMRPGFLATPGQVVGMVFAQGGIITTCCTAGMPASMPFRFVSVNPPNDYLNGLIITIVWNGATLEWQGTAVTAHGTLRVHWLCDGAFGWKWLVDVSYSGNTHVASACGTITFSHLITGPLGSSFATMEVNGGTPPPVTVYSLVFDGSTGYVDCGADVPAQFPAGVPFSLSLWVKPSGSGGSYIPFSLANPSTAAGWYCRWNRGGNPTMELFFFDGGSFWSVGGPGSSVPTGVWTHVVYTYDGSGTDAGRKMYLNGVETTETHFDIGTPGDPNYTGAHCNHGRRDDVSEYYLGKLCQPAVWNVELSAAEVAGLFAGADPTSVGSPLNVWLYTEGSGTNVVDAIGTATGTIVGGVTWDTDIPAPL